MSPAFQPPSDPPPVISHRPTTDATTPSHAVQRGARRRKTACMNGVMTTNMPVMKAALLARGLGQPERLEHVAGGQEDPRDQARPQGAGGEPPQGGGEQHDEGDGRDRETQTEERPGGIATPPRP